MSNLNVDDKMPHPVFPPAVGDLWRIVEAAAVDGLAPSGSIYPYFIVSPAYSRTSAGVRALHLLCHWLNRSGYPAYIWSGGVQNRSFTNPDLLTPQVTQEVIEHYQKVERTPIVLYPEVVPGNPLGAECVVRFLGNYPGLLGGDSEFPASELVFGYTDALCASVPDATGRLFIPVVDTRMYCPGDGCVVRRGACFYAAKYRLAGFEPFGLPYEAREIFRNPEEAQTPSEIVEIFRSSEVFYAFEDTALILEALLCGCPVLIMRSQFFQQPLGLSFLGSHGICFDEADLPQAKASLPDFRAAFDSKVRLFADDLRGFVEKSQVAAARFYPAFYSFPPPYLRLARSVVEIDGRPIPCWVKIPFIGRAGSSFLKAALHVILLYGLVRGFECIKSWFVMTRIAVLVEVPYNKCARAFIEIADYQHLRREVSWGLLRRFKLKWISRVEG